MQINATGVLAVVGVGIAAYVGWRAYNGAGAVVDRVAETVRTDLNPTNPQNLANRGFNTIQKAATGEATFSDYLLKVFNPGAYDALNGGGNFTPFPGKAPDTGDETQRLLNRYPAPAVVREPSSVFSGAGSFSEGADLGSLGFGGLWPPGFFTGTTQ